MKDTIVTIFQTYPFLQTEWFYTALAVLLGFFTAILGFVMWRVDAKYKRREERIQTLSRIVDIDIQLKEVYRVNWAHITELPGESDKEVLKREFKDVDQNIRKDIHNVIDILADVYKHFKSFEMPLDETWEAHFYHTFNPVTKKAFVTAFYKYEADERFSKSFVKFVKEIIEYNSNNNQDIETIQVQKAEGEA